MGTQVIRHLLLLTVTILLPATAWSQADTTSQASEAPPGGFNVQAHFSFVNQTGNVEGTTFSGGVTAVYWTGSISNTLDYSGNVQHLESEDNSSDYQVHAIQDILRINLLGSLFGIAGLDWERNEPKLIESRFSYHLGLGYDVLAEPDHSLGFIAAAGRTSESTTVPISGLDEHYTSFYLMNRYDYQVTEDLDLRQSLGFFTPTQDLSNYRMRFSASLNSTIYKAIGLAITFKLNYDNDPHNPISTAQPDGKKLDTSQTISLTVRM